MQAIIYIYCIYIWYAIKSKCYIFLYYSHYVTTLAQRVSRMRREERRRVRWQAAKASGEEGVCRQAETSVLLSPLLGNWRGRGLEIAWCWEQARPAFSFGWFRDQR